LDLVTALKQTYVSVVQDAVGNVANVEMPANVLVAVDVPDVKLFAIVQVLAYVDVIVLVRQIANVNLGAPASETKTPTTL
ncbi:hypothetical protein AM593_03594, partial [Mytilus galloprovincialis]